MSTITLQQHKTRMFPIPNLDQSRGRIPRIWRNSGIIQERLRSLPLSAGAIFAPPPSCSPRGRSSPCSSGNGSSMDPGVFPGATPGNAVGIGIGNGNGKGKAPGMRSGRGQAALARCGRRSSVLAPAAEGAGGGKGEAGENRDGSRGINAALPGKGNGECRSCTGRSLSPPWGSLWGPAMIPRQGSRSGVPPWFPFRGSRHDSPSGVSPWFPLRSLAPGSRRESRPGIPLWLPLRGPAMIPPQGSRSGSRCDSPSGVPP